MGNPTVTPLVEQWHDGGFLVSQPNGHRHVDQGVLIAGAKVLAGTIVGKITASGKFVTCISTASDGSQVPAGILFGTKDATAADKPCLVVRRDCEVNTSELIWDASFNAGAITTGLATLAGLGIIGR